MHNLISVIVPIYKVEPYIRQCIDSIINQTYKNLEIILVDDGSPDGCPQICDEYATKDTRVIVIHKENGGLSSARNAGLEIATGDYIAFVDSDDWLDFTMYERLYDVAVKTDSDITTCGIKYHDASSEIESSLDTGSVIEWEKYEAIKKLITPVYNIRFEVWNKLFKSSLIRNIRFKEGQVYEDVYFDRIVFLNANKIVTLNTNLYYYRVSRPGNTNSSFTERKLQIFKELDDFIYELNHIGHSDIGYIYLCYAIETCMSFYIAANKLAKSPMIVKKLFSQYIVMYSKLKLRTIFFNPRYVLFRLSPSLYKIIRSLLR